MNKSITHTSHLLIFVLLFGISSCSLISKKQDKRVPVARVYDNYLYKSDLKNIVPEDASAKDSVTLIHKYIQNWIRERLIVHKAEANLTDQQKDVQRQLQDYRNSLITYIYEKELVRQQLDTAVSDSEMQKYYNANKNNFELKDNIVRVIYVKVSKKAPKIDKVKKWYKSDKPKDRKLLVNYCYQFAENFYLNDNNWLLFDDLLKEIPIETYNKELFLKNNKYVEVQDSLNDYFLNIEGYKIKNSISPLAFEKDNIRKIILNKRKLQLIDKMKADVYEAAEIHKDFKVY